MRDEDFHYLKNFVATEEAAATLYLAEEVASASNDLCSISEQLDLNQAYPFGLLFCGA